MIPNLSGEEESSRTTTDGLALALTSAAGAVAAVAVGEEQTGTGGEENCRESISMLEILCAVFLVEYSGRAQCRRTTLLHGETCTFVLAIMVPLILNRIPNSVPIVVEGVVVPCLSLPPVILNR